MTAKIGSYLNLLCSNLRVLSWPFLFRFTGRSWGKRIRWWSVLQFCKWQGNAQESPSPPSTQIKTPSPCAYGDASDSRGEGRWRSTSQGRERWGGGSTSFVRRLSINIFIKKYFRRWGRIHMSVTSFLPSPPPFLVSVTPLPSCQ